MRAPLSPSAGPPAAAAARGDVDRARPPPRGRPRERSVTWTNEEQRPPAQPVEAARAGGRRARPTPRRRSAGAGANAGVRPQSAHLDLRARTAAAHAAHAELERFDRAAAPCDRGAGTACGCGASPGVRAWLDACAARRRSPRAARVAATPRRGAPRAHRATHALERLRRAAAPRSRRRRRACSTRPARARSDAWFELAEHFRRDAWRFGSAVHCLREWHEPLQTRPISTRAATPATSRCRARARARRRARRAGRRNLALWEALTSVPLVTCRARCRADSRPARVQSTGALRGARSAPVGLAPVAPRASRSGRSSCTAAA